MNKSNNRKEILSLLCFNFFFTFMIFVFAPLEFYLSNKEYFFFSGEEMLLFICLFWTSSFTISTVIMLILYKRINKGFIWIIGGLSGLTLALYIQGNYIIVDYGAMDGRTIEWDHYKTQGMISVIVFILVIVVIMLMIYKVKREVMFRFIKIVSICLILVQLVTLSTLMITKHGLHKEAEYVATEDEEFSLSKDENIIVLLLDTFDSQIFANMLEDDNAKNYKNILQDFIYYPDTVASYAATDLAVPNIITGCSFKNDRIYGDYLREAYSASPFLTRLKEENWYSGIYSVCMPPQGNGADKAGNFEKLERTVSSHRRLAGYMYKFVGFRYLPQPLKKYCWFYPEEMNSAIECTVDSSKTLFNDNNFYFYDRIPEITADNIKKTFHFYHLDGTHAPFTIKSDFTGSEKEVGIEEEGRGMMVLIDTFLKELKEKNIYNNSTIIIMADHGYYNMRQNPLFIVKDKDANQEFKINDSAFSFFNLQELFVNVLDGKSTNEYINSNSVKNSRIFCYYSWDYDMGEKSYSTDITVYNVSGKAWESDSYKPSGIVYYNNCK